MLAGRVVLQIYLSLLLKDADVRPRSLPWLLLPEEKGEGHNMTAEADTSRDPHLIPKDLEYLVPLKVFEEPCFVDGQYRIVRAFLWGNHVAFDVDDGQDAGGKKRFKGLAGDVPSVFLMKAAVALHRTQEGQVAK